MDGTSSRTCHKPFKILAQKSCSCHWLKLSLVAKVLSIPHAFAVWTLLDNSCHTCSYLDLKEWHTWCVEAIEYALYDCSESEWILSTLFTKRIEFFIKCMRLQKSPVRQVLPILDSPLTQNVTNLSRDYEIIVFSLPAHTTHKLQAQNG